MIDPVLHTLMVAQSYYTNMEFATPQDCIDVAARRLFDDVELQQDASQKARGYLNDTGCFTDAFVALYADRAA